MTPFSGYRVISPTSFGSHTFTGFTGGAYTSCPNQTVMTIPRDTWRYGYISSYSQNYSPETTRAFNWGSNLGGECWTTVHNVGGASRQIPLSQTTSNSEFSMLSFIRGNFNNDVSMSHKLLFSYVDLQPASDGQALRPYSFEDFTRSISAVSGGYYSIQNFGEDYTVPARTMSVGHLMVLPGSLLSQSTTFMLQVSEGTTGSLVARNTHSSYNAVSTACRMGLRFVLNNLFSNTPTAFSMNFMQVNSTNSTLSTEIRGNMVYWRQS